MDELNQVFTEIEESDAPEHGGAGTMGGDALHWGRCYRDLLDMPAISPIVEELIGNHVRQQPDIPTFRIDHINVHTHPPGVFGYGLHGGNGLLDGMLDLVPSARVGHVGLYRDPQSLEPVQYYMKLPEHIGDRPCIAVDPMLATGGSAIMAADRMKKKGCNGLVFVCLIAAPEGVCAFQHAHPDIPIITAALDRQLDKNCYILPGLGDAGDRIYNTV